MSDTTTSTSSPLTQNEPELSSESSQTCQLLTSPLEELWEKDVTQMDNASLREHLMRLREVVASPQRTRQLLKDESDAIANKRPVVRKRIEISSDLY
jgi:DNA gyrase/topoisomerase IV subunit A